MKQKFLLAIILSLPLFGLAQSQVINSWRDPNTSIQNPGVHRIVVAALINDQGVRRQIEDYMVTLYPGQATQSYQIMGDSLVQNEERESQELKAKGFDGIVIMKQVDENTTSQYVPGQAPSYWHSWGGYWGWNGWGGPRWVNHYNPGTPGHVQNQWHWYVQVNVYSLVTDKLIFSANTVTTNPHGRVPLFQDVCVAVRSTMSSDGFIQ